MIDALVRAGVREFARVDLMHAGAGRGADPGIAASLQDHEVALLRRHAQERDPAIRGPRGGLGGDRASRGHHQFRRTIRAERLGQRERRGAGSRVASLAVAHRLAVPFEAQDLVGRVDPQLQAPQDPPDHADVPRRHRPDRAPLDLKRNISLGLHRRRAGRRRIGRDSPAQFQLAAGRERGRHAVPLPGLDRLDRKRLARRDTPENRRIIGRRTQDQLQPRRGRLGDRAFELPLVEAASHRAHGRDHVDPDPVQPLAPDFHPPAPFDRPERQDAIPLAGLARHQPIQPDRHPRRLRAGQGDAEFGRQVREVAEDLAFDRHRIHHAADRLGDAGSTLQLLELIVERALQDHEIGPIQPVLDGIQVIRAVDEHINRRGPRRLVGGRGEGRAGQERPEREDEAKARAVHEAQDGEPWLDGGSAPCGDRFIAGIERAGTLPAIHPIDPLYHPQRRPSRLSLRNPECRAEMGNGVRNRFRFSGNGS